MAVVGQAVGAFEAQDGNPGEVPRFKRFDGSDPEEEEDEGEAADEKNCPGRHGPGFIIEGVEQLVEGAIASVVENAFRSSNRSVGRGLGSPKPKLRAFSPIGHGEVIPAAGLSASECDDIICVKVHGRVSKPIKSSLPGHFLRHHLDLRFRNGSY